jgi:uncharacterized protein YjbJ (UPF0337 family)
MRPNENEIRGKIDEATGTIKEHVGRATGDIGLESEGADQRLGGDIESGVGKARRKIGEAVSDIGKKLGK